MVSTGEHNIFMPSLQDLSTILNRMHIVDLSPLLCGWKIFSGADADRNNPAPSTAILQRRAKRLNHINSSFLAQEGDTRNAETILVHPER